MNSSQNKTYTYFERDPEGKTLTKPLYDNITDIGFDLYKAENGGNYIVINGKGQTVNEPLPPSFFPILVIVTQISLLFTE